MKAIMKDLIGKVLGKKITLEMAQKCKHIIPLEKITIRKEKWIYRRTFSPSKNTFTFLLIITRIWALICTK